MQDALNIFVPGKPEPAGSKTAIPLKNKYTGKWITDASGRPVINVTDDNPKSKQWKKAVAQLAKSRYFGPPLEGPVVLWLTFTLQRPKGHYGTGRNADTVKGSSPARPVVKPDVLKLARGVEDALTAAGIWCDDAQIVDEHLSKHYGESEGVQIRVQQLAATPLLEPGATHD